MHSVNGTIDSSHCVNSQKLHHASEFEVTKVSVPGAGS